MRLGKKSSQGAVSVSTFTVKSVCLPKNPPVGHEINLLGRFGRWGSGSTSPWTGDYHFWPPKPMEKQRLWWRPKNRTIKSAEGESPCLVHDSEVLMFDDFWTGIHSWWVSLKQIELIHSPSLTWNLNRMVCKFGISYSRVPFWGSILKFGRVSIPVKQFKQPD